MADVDLDVLRAVIAETAADWPPDAERRVLDRFDALVAEVERLREALSRYMAAHMADNTDSAFWWRTGDTFEVTLERPDDEGGWHYVPPASEEARRG